MKKIESIYQFKITLNDSKPPIWRRIQVPSDHTFFDFHVALQDIMGWTDSHLHAFRISPKGVKEIISIQYPSPDDNMFWDSRPPFDERKEKIADYFGKTIKQCIYEYDFGDSWDHTVLFEKEMAIEKGIVYPLCVDGENACPPEDCGGMGGYEELQKVIKNAKHPDHADMMNWLGLEDPKDFDPTEFKIQDVSFEDPKKRLREYRKGFGM